MTSGKQARAERQAKIDAAAPKENKSRLILGLVIALVAVLGIGAVVFLATRESQSDAPAQTPAAATGPEGGIVANPGGLVEGAPTLDVYEDFQCPACAQAHELLSPTIASMIEDKKLNVVYHLKTFLDDNLRNDSSMRAANAAVCASDAGKFREYHDAVYSHQPEREGAGFTDADLSTFAQTAGIAGDQLGTWNECVSQRTYVNYLDKVEEETARDGVTSTPTFRVNGHRIEFGQATTAEEYVNQFTQAVTQLGALPPNPSTSETTTR